MPLLFAISLPIGLAKKNNARACMESFITYATATFLRKAYSTVSQLRSLSYFIDLVQSSGVNKTNIDIYSVTVNLGLVYDGEKVWYMKDSQEHSL